MELPWSPPATVPTVRAKATSQPKTRSRHRFKQGPLCIPPSNAKRFPSTLEQNACSESLLNAVCRWFLQHQASFSFNLIAFLLLVHYCIPTTRPFTSSFFTLSHYNSNTGNYAVGSGDLCFVTFCVLVLTGMRAGVMEHVLRPVGKSWGISKKANITRFAEQTWLLCYYGVFYSLGLYVYCNSKYFLNMKELWTDYPTRELPAIVKFYILGQLSFWVQQIFVIYIEERRKDHWQMLAHHVVTIGLISTCYAYHFTGIGNLILILMDLVDIFFPIAKCLKYLGYTTLCNIMFGVFVLAWFITRHLFYVITLYCMWRDMPVLLPNGCFHGSQDNLTGPYEVPHRSWSQIIDPLRNPTGVICYSDNVRWTYLAALGFLQVLTIGWFLMIVRVAFRVIQGVSADDPRSDNEAEEEDQTKR